MSAAFGWTNRRTNDSAYNYNQEFETIWDELYNAKDRNCPVLAAIHQTAWRRRPNHIGLGDFEKALLGRVYQKLKINFRNKRQAGMSAEEWRQKIGKLTVTANSAAGEEVRALIEGGRSKSKPDIHQLDDCALFACRESGSVVDREFLPQSDQALDKAGRELPPAHMSNDSGGPMLRFLRGELRTRDMLEHFRVCEDCQAALQLINDQLIDFVVAASSRAISMRHVSVINRLRLRTGAIQFLLQCRGYENADQAALGRLDGNLGVLGYGRPLQHTGKVRSRHSSPRRMLQRDKFLTLLVETSTLLVLLNGDYEMTRRSCLDWPIIPASTEWTLSNIIAVGAMVRLVRSGRVVFFRKGLRRTNASTLTKF